MRLGNPKPEGRASWQEPPPWCSRCSHCRSADREHGPLRPRARSRPHEVEAGFELRT